MRGLHWVLLGLLSHYLVLHGFTQLDSVLLCFHASTWLYRVLKGLIGSYKVLQGFTWFHQISATFMDVYRHFLYGEQTTTWMVGGRGRIDRSNSRAKKKKNRKGNRARRSNQSKTVERRWRRVSGQVWFVCSASHTEFNKASVALTWPKVFHKVEPFYLFPVLWVSWNGISLECDLLDFSQRCPDNSGLLGFTKSF